MNCVGVFHFKRLSKLSTKLFGIGIHRPAPHHCLLEMRNDVEDFEL